MAKTRVAGVDEDGYLTGKPLEGLTVTTIPQVTQQQLKPLAERVTVLENKPAPAPQVLSLENKTLTLSGGGGSVQLPTSDVKATTITDNGDGTISIE